MPPIGKDEAWLRALSNRLGVQNHSPQTLQPRKSPYSTTKNSNDESQATLLLTQASEKRRTGQPKTMTNGGKVKKDKWTYEDYFTVLTEIISTGSASLGVAESVWNNFQIQKPKKARTGSILTSRRHRATNDDDDTHLLNLLTTALNKNHEQVDMLQFLANSASSKVVSNILPTAIRMRSIKAVQVLIEENADPNTCPKDFVECAAAGELDLIRLLLQSQTQIIPATLTNALPAAVQIGNIEIIQLLLTHGADANFQDGIALEHAVHAHRVDMIVLFLLCQNPPSATTLASMVSYIYSKLQVSRDMKYELIEILLNGGANGEDILPGAVQDRWGELVQLLVDKGTPISSCNAEAYRLAVNTVDLEMLRILNTEVLGRDLAINIFNDIYETQHGASLSPENWYILAEMLLHQGVTGHVVHEALIDRVSVRDLKSVKLLLTRGASVDYKNGRALGIAVGSEKLNYIETLLQYQPTVASLNSVFPRADGLSHGVRVDITRKLLEAGATGAAVDGNLDSAMNQYKRDRLYIKALVQGGADVSQKQGDLLRLATQSGDYKTLKILLKGDFSPTILSTCIPLAMKLGGEQRYTMLEILLANGARGPTVSQALVDSIDGTHSGGDLAALLVTVGEANTGFGKGEAIKKAITSDNLGFLKLLVQHNHLDESEFCSCLLLAIDLPLGDRARLEKIKLLLSTGSVMSGNTGTAALQQEMRSLKHHDQETLGILPVLLEAGANVNHNHGQILCDTIRMGLFEYFKLYLSVHLSSQSLEASFKMALAYALQNFDLRYIRELLRKGISNSDIDNALLEACNEDGNEDLALLLLEFNASVNYQQGSAICKAISRLDFRLLAQLLHHAPNGVSLEKGFELSMAFSGIEAKFKLFSLLLEAGRVPNQLLNTALTSATEGGRKGTETCELLLKHHASPDYNKGAPFCHAIKSPNYDISMIQLLLRFNPSKNTIATALTCAFDTLRSQNRLAAINLLVTSTKPQSTLDQLLLKGVRESRIDHDLIRSLLQANASALYQGGESIYHAVMKNDMESLNMFQPYFTGQSSIVSRAFQDAWYSGARAESHQEALSLLLKTGAAGECVSIALLETIKTSASLPFILDLLAAGADVNYNQGASLVEASSRGNLQVLQKLFMYNPQRSNMTLAFPRIFASGVDTQTLRGLVEAFCSHTSSPLSQPSHSKPILLLLLKNYPTEIALLKYLIDAGCPFDPVVQSSQGEDISLLCWALEHNANIIPDGVIDVLVAAGANTNYQTPKSHRTPLQIAISTSRNCSVATLLKNKADPLVETGNTLSPLSLATSSGNSNIVHQLLDAGAILNDGSLHHAAQRVDIEIIQVFVEEWNQKDYACSSFEGRTALAELCLNAKNKSPSQLKKAMLLLKKHGDFRRKSNGKSILHFALDNADAISVTTALLDTFMSEFINEEFNLYENDDLVYSPLAYVIKGQNRAPASQQGALMRLLKQFQCRNRFWARKGNQPPDVADPPEEIAQMVKDKEDYDRRRERRRTETADELAIKEAHHGVNLRHQQEVADKTADIEKKTAARQAKITADQHDAELTYFTRATELMNRRQDDENRRAVEHKKQIGYVEQEQQKEKVKLAQKMRDDEFKDTKKREKLLTSGYRERAEIDQKRLEGQFRLLDAQKRAAEASALSHRSMRELDYETNSLD